MKKSRFVVFLLLFILPACSGGEDHSLHDDSDQTLNISGIQQRDTVFLTFNIPQKTIRASRTGKLERLVETPEMTKNSLLVQFDNYDAFVEISGEKEALKEELNDRLNQLPASLRSIEKKWRDFAEKLTPDRTMPDFPAYEYKEEAAFMDGTPIRDQYRSIHKKELALQNYFQLSTEDGFIIQAFAHTDDQVKKNSPLLLYHPRKITVTAEAAFPITKKISQQIKSDLLLRIPVERAVKQRTSPQKVTYSLTLNQRLDPRICPAYVIINHEENAFRVPEDFVGKQNQVTLEGSKEQLTAYRKNGSYYVYSKQPSLTIRKNGSRRI